MSGINCSEKIPNNGNLSEDRTLQRAFEHWQPNYLQWWQDMGPEGSQNFDVYLRTAVSVDPQGWGAPMTTCSRAIPTKSSTPRPVWSAGTA